MPIVAAVDDSKRAATIIDEARGLADDLDEELHVVHVLERSELVSVLETEIEGQDVVDNHEVQAVGRNIVAEAIDDPDSADVTVTVRVGDPASEIESYAADLDARYVVIGGRQRSPTGKALFGSVTQDVLLNAPAPIVNVPIE